MRMDRYEEEDIDQSKKSRTDKNQELYTDVYLNNAYVDISEINEVVSGEEEKLEEKKIVKTETVPYTYKEKNYDINLLIEEAIKNNEDNLKRSIEHTTEIDGIIKSINEAQKEKEKSDNKELLEFLMPDSDTTTIVGPLENAILDTKILDTSVIHKGEMSNDFLEEIEKEDVSDKPKLNQEKKEDEEMDETFKDETKVDKKKIFIIVGIVLVILIVVGILIWKK